jgi:hypothetical protein
MTLSLLVEFHGIESSRAIAVTPHEPVGCHGDGGVRGLP